VYAYLKPNSNLAIGPTQSIQVNQFFDDKGDYSLWSAEVTHEDIEAKLVDLVEPFDRIPTSQQLYALVKYYFLLAVEESLCEYSGHFIPVNQSFISEMRTFLRDNSGIRFRKRVKVHQQVRDGTTPARKRDHKHTTPNSDSENHAHRKRTKRATKGSVEGSPVVNRIAVTHMPAEARAPTNDLERSADTDFENLSGDQGNEQNDQQEGQSDAQEEQNDPQEEQNDPKEELQEEQEEDVPMNDAASVINDGSHSKAATEVLRWQSGLRFPPTGMETCTNWEGNFISRDDTQITVNGADQDHSEAVRRDVHKEKNKTIEIPEDGESESSDHQQHGNFGFGEDEWSSESAQSQSGNSEVSTDDSTGNSEAFLRRCDSRMSPHSVRPRAQHHKKRRSKTTRSRIFEPRQTREASIRRHESNRTSRRGNSLKESTNTVQQQNRVLHRISKAGGRVTKSYKEQQTYLLTMMNYLPGVVKAIKEGDVAAMDFHQVNKERKRLRNRRG
jgi:hypothetical protein